MTRSITITLAAWCLVGFSCAERVQARGIGGFGGGFHGGGFAGGGFHGGGFGGQLSAGRFSPGQFGGERFGNAGDFRPGGFSGEGLGGMSREGLRGGTPGGFDANRFNTGGARPGGWAGGNFDRMPTRSSLNSFLGLPSDAGLHSLSSPGGSVAQRGAAYRSRGGAAAGGKISGPRGGSAGRGAVVGPRGNAAGGRYVTGPRGNTYAQGFAAGPRGLHTVSAAHLHTGGTAVRANFHSWHLYSPGWYRRYPGAWFAAGWAAGYAWRAATWPAVYGWFGYPALNPIYYDYGTSVVYQDNSVYVNGQDVGTAQQYYQQAENLVDTGTQAQASDEGQWMPLGVFALTRDGQNNADMTYQLAVNKEGVVRGNYTNTVIQQVLPIYGSVDKKTQRIAWSVGKNTETVIETGLYNLTKDEAPALIHFGPDRTEQWMLVRLQQPPTDIATPTAAE
ncbi:MAG: protocadherin [Pirellulales bacterium]|nr:protocadherin [Pirellulales bacterium]